MSGFVTKKIGRKRSLASILRVARHRAGLTLEEAETQTRIRHKYLTALESSQYQLLPADAYNVGFVRGYAEFLKLNPEKIVNLYREERSATRIGADADVKFSPQKVGDWQFLITPKVLGTVVTILLFGGVIAYILGQLNHFKRPPDLTITSIPAEFASDKDKVQIAGNTSGGASVLINSEQIVVSPSGQFSQDVQLTPGVNEIHIQSRGHAGTQTERLVRILFNQNLAKADQNGTNN